MLGKLEKVELRKIWKTEDQGFTPWLAEEKNLELLGETTEMESETRQVPLLLGLQG
jgi:hypothetical protein